MHILSAIIISYFILCGQLFAQQSISGFKRFGRAEGVPTSSNNRIFESSDGFLWLSTSSGLYRFDGYQFSPFFANNKDSSSLSSNVISAIEEDRHGNLWVGTFGKGVNKLNRKTGKWQQYLHPTKDDNPFYWIFDLFKDARGRLWLGTSGRGLLLYDEASDSFRQYLPNPAKSSTGLVRFENEVRGIAADAKEPDVLWLAATDGLYRFNIITKKFTWYQNLKNAKATWINNSFHNLYVQDDNIWLGAWGGGLVHFNTSSLAFTNYTPVPQEYARESFANNIICAVSRCSDTSLYVSAGGDGLFEFNLNRHSFKKLNKAEGEKEKIPAFSGISQSSDGSTWICSSDNIFQKNPVYNRLASFRQFYQPTGKFVYRPALHGLLYRKEKQEYWMSCNAGYGVYVYDCSFNYLRSLPLEGQATDRQLREIVADATGTIWLRSRDFPFLYYYDEAKNLFRNASAKFKEAAFADGRLLDMVSDKRGCIWFANSEGLVRWRPQEKKLQHIPVNESAANKLNLQRAKICFDANGDPWLAADKGVYQFNIITGQWLHINAKKNAASLFSNSVTAFSIDAKGLCWMAPEDEGLQVYDPVKRKFIKHYTQSEGFVSQRVNYLQADSRGDTWAVTINGLAKFDAAQQRWQTFTTDDGLPTDYLYDPLFAMADGKMIFAAEDGFVFWNIHSLPANKIKPVVYFNRFIAAGKTISGNTPSINLAYNRNDLNVEFGAIVTVMGSRTSFYYQLLPGQKEWMPTAQRSIALARFAPGTYRLRIKAVNADGVESEIKELQIKVAYPLWQKWWFIVAALLLLAAILYMLYRYRVNQLLRLQQMRNNISRDLHDEIGSSVSSVNMLSMVAKQQLGPGHAITPLLTQISQSAQSAGDSINEIIWSINPKNDSMERIVLRMKELASEMLELNKINYQLHFNIQPGELAIPMQHRRHLFMIYKEALNNMIKYAACSNAVLSMHIINKKLELKIEDDGAGFNLALHKPGNGLLNMQERAKEMKGTLLINTAPGKGCSIILHYPLKK